MASRSRRWVIPTVLGVLVLSILVGLLGWKLGERDARNALPQTPIGDSPSASASASSGAPEESCPAVTVTAAHGTGGVGAISVQLYVQTEDAEAWVCHDANGTLFYQGHSGNGPIAQASAATSNNDGTLFLTDVKRDSDAYVATNAGNSGSTTYRLSADRLTVTRNGAVIYDKAVQIHRP
jgi:hypothetical protein